MTLRVWFAGVIAGAFFTLGSAANSQARPFCWTGAFLADHPTAQDVEQFQKDFGKKPYLILLFIDWERYVDEQDIKNLTQAGCNLLITWEPWHAQEKTGIGYDDLLAGKYDTYINQFGRQLKDIPKTVYLRFAHEMNGNWYPWCLEKLGKQKFVAVYRHVKDVIDAAGAKNVRWVFSVNAEDVPAGQGPVLSYYPGDTYVDYTGIDGYNWGDTKSWSKWTSFKHIFGPKYKELSQRISKPIMITEFSSASRGGDKKEWIQKAMKDMQRMDKIKSFVLFNVDKETDWSFSADEDSGKELKAQLQNDYFRDK